MKISIVQINQSYINRCKNDATIIITASNNAIKRTINKNKLN